MSTPTALERVRARRVRRRGRASRSRRTCSRATSCQAAVAPMVEPARLDAAWAEIVDRLDAPQLGPVERLLRRAGLPEHLARLLAATPSLTVSWLVAVALAAGVRGRRRPSRRSRACCCSECLAALLPRGRRRRGVRARARSRLRGRARRPVLERSAAADPRGRRAGRHDAAAPAWRRSRCRARAGRRRPGCCRRWRSPLASLALATYISPRRRVRRRDGGVVGGRRRERRRPRRPARRLPRRRADRVRSRSPPSRRPCSSTDRDRLDLGRGR